MHGDAGIQLIKEAVHSQQTKRLSEYPHETVQTVLNECRLLATDLQQILLTKDDQKKTSATLHHLSLLRNKRCLLAYHRYRLSVLNQLAKQQNTPMNLSPPDTETFHQLTTLQQWIRGQFLDLDLAALDVPPKDVFIEVRVLKDCGELLTESGPILLLPGSQHYLRRTDVEHLIAQGYLQHVSC
jgi:GINS complex subunit 1